MFQPNPSGTHEFTPGFNSFGFTQSLVCRVVFVLFYSPPPPSPPQLYIFFFFFFYICVLLYCLSFYDLLIWLHFLVTSNVSWKKYNFPHLLRFFSQILSEKISLIDFCLARQLNRVGGVTVNVLALYAVYPG